MRQRASQLENTYDPQDNSVCTSFGPMAHFAVSEQLLTYSHCTGHEQEYSVKSSLSWHWGSKNQSQRLDG
jgi:hypothetical protein